jgi:YesN/AraC family two-component response regulator
VDIKLLLELSKKFTLLYVEDEETLRTQTAAIFKTFFKEVIVACDGEEGLNAYKTYYTKNDKYIDLIITDINMPVMSGQILIEHIYKIHHAQTIIVMSAQDDASYLIPLLECGISNFLLKPVKMDRLVKVLFKTVQLIDDVHALENYKEQIEILSDEYREKNQILIDKNRLLEKKLKAKNEKREFVEEILNDRELF